MSYTESELAGLTPEEQDALLAEETTSTEANAEPVVEQVATDEVVETAADVVADAEQEAADVSAEEVAEEVKIGDFQPEFNATAPEGIADTIAALSAKADELLAKFGEGDIELSEYLAEKSQIDSQLFQAKLADEQAKWAATQNQAQRAQRWEWEQERFFSAKTAEIYNDPILMATLNATVQSLGASPDNAKRPMSWFLEEADRQVRQRFGGVKGAVESPVAAVVPPKPAPQPTIKTIGGLPAAAPAPIGDDIMAKIGTLEGEELERYFARLSPADVDKLSRAAS